VNDTKYRIAQRASQELKKHSIINLGIGIPTLISQFINEDEYVLHTENGLLGVGKLTESNIDPLIINAGKMPVGEALGASYFSSAESFAMIRGNHVDTAVLGALQIDESGKIANWAIPGKDILGVGGAMDLLEGANEIIVATTHTSNDGEPKFVKECTYPLSSNRAIDILVTELAVFKWRNGHFELVDLLNNTTLEEVQQKTKAFYTVAPHLIKKVKESAK
jgi:3-oxoacid CoA-transferase B subunit